MLLFLIINVKRLQNSICLTYCVRAHIITLNLISEGTKSGKPDPFNREDTANSRTAPAAVRTDKRAH